jgi:hypothetical protein
MTRFANVALPAIGLTYDFAIIQVVEPNPLDLGDRLIEYGR